MTSAPGVRRPRPARGRRAWLATGPAGVGRLASLALAAALLASLAGCSRPRAERPANPLDTVAVDTTRHPAPELGPPIGRSDALVNEAAPQLAEWVALWRAAMPSFATDSLHRGGKRRWAPVYSREVEKMPANDPDWASERNAREALSVRSPDGARVLEIDTYQGISEDEGGAIDIGGEPDSAPALVDVATNTEHVLEVWGTMGGFHWGSWLDARRFVLGSWFEDEDGTAWSGGLSFYSLDDSTVTSYVTRPVRETEFDRYRAAWREWVIRRYRKSHIAALTR